MTTDLGEETYADFLGCFSRQENRHTRLVMPATAGAGNLDMIRPHVVVVYDADLPFFRQLEVRD